MDRLLDMERRLLRMACPGCGRAASLQTAVKCQLAYGECLYTVCCRRL